MREVSTQKSAASTIAGPNFGPPVQAPPVRRAVPTVVAVSAEVGVEASFPFAALIPTVAAILS